MPTEMTYPFALNTDGSIATTADPNVQINQHIESLVSTQPGERVMLPAYGVNTFGQLFAPDNDVATAALINDVTAAMQTWEPNVNVVDIATVPVPGDFYPGGTTGIEIDWSPVAVQSPAAAGTITATILVGGDVIEDAVTS
jgi:phage baseplate assembly protein W